MTVVLGVIYLMMGLTVAFVALLAAVTALPTDLPEPSQFALVFNEDDFEDYLDAWLEQEEPKWANVSSEVSPRNAADPIIINDGMNPVDLTNRHECQRPNEVVYDASRRQGTAFVSINNPYYTAAEARSLTFCTDRCRNNNAFSWLRWQPDRIDIGYSFCCTVDDFRRTVPHLPAFTTTGLLT